MTHHDLAELLRDHVSHDEPPALLPQPALTAGRRRLRNRRLASAGASLAVLALAAAVVVPRLGGSEAADDAMDPVSTEALANYDALAMPELMDSHVRRVLEASVPDLGPSDFTAWDSQGQELPERYWEKASGLSVEYGTDEHRYSVNLSHAKSEAEGNPERYCAEGLADGSFVDCTVTRTADGDVVINSLWALKPMRFENELVSMKLIYVDRLDNVSLDDLYFERRVKVIKSETLITYVSERVRAVDRDPANAAFTTPADDLAAIGTDPELVMPAPPPGDNGCPAWTMPSKDIGEVSCQ